MKRREYHRKRKEAHKIIRNKKKTYIKNVIELVEKDQSITTQRKLSNNKSV
jgi:hypothetical protein